MSLIHLHIWKSPHETRFYASRIDEFKKGSNMPQLLEVKFFKRTDSGLPDFTNIFANLRIMRSSDTRQIRQSSHNLLSLVPRVFRRVQTSD